jgi:hypothetical protein
VPSFSFWVWILRPAQSFGHVQERKDRTATNWWESLGYGTQDFRIWRHYFLASRKWQHISHEKFILWFVVFKTGYAGYRLLLAVEKNADKSFSTHSNCVNKIKPLLFFLLDSLNCVTLLMYRYSTIYAIVVLQNKFYRGWDHINLIQFFCPSLTFFLQRPSQ